MQAPPMPAQLYDPKWIDPSETVCGVVSAVQSKLPPANETAAMLLELVVGVQLYESKQPAVFALTDTWACETPATLATITAAMVTFRRNFMCSP
jgi:hypothetical protein